MTKKTEEVQRETQLLYEEVDGLKAEYKDIKSLLDEKDNDLRSLLQHETSQRELHLSKLEDQILGKQTQIKEVFFLSFFFLSFFLPFFLSLFMHQSITKNIDHQLKYSLPRKWKVSISAKIKKIYTITQVALVFIAMWWP